MEEARKILANMDRIVPGLVLVRLRRIGLEIRAGRYSEADALYQASLSATMSLEMRNFYTWRYARFTDKVAHSCSVVPLYSACIDLGIYPWNMTWCHDGQGVLVCSFVACAVCVLC